MPADKSTLSVGSIGYIDGDPTRPALILGLDSDDEGHEFVTYEALGAGIRAPSGTIVSQADVQAAKAAAETPETSGA